MSRSRKPDSDNAGGEAKIDSADRLQKVLAAAGVGSRRDCEELITQGRVEVDRKVITELGSKVDPLQHEIRVDGVVLHRPKKLYFALNKPEGVVTTNFDPSGRTRVIDLIPTEERVFPIGRLDRASEGLILVTNDGELANRVTHPRYGVEKTYHVRVEGVPSTEELQKLHRGVYIAEGLARVASVKVKSRHKNVSDLEIVLKEGKNREIRRVLAKIGHKVLKLKRLAVGPVKLGELGTGMSRRLMPQELEALLDATRRRRKEGKRGTSSEAVKPDESRDSSPRSTTPRSKTPRSDHRQRDDDSSPVRPRQAQPVTRSRPPEPVARAAPVVSAPGNAPPKLDLAMLLNPSLAPKKAMSVTAAVQQSQRSQQPSRPAIGDVISYDAAADDASLAPAEFPQRKRRRPLREYETDSEPIEHLDRVGEADEVVEDDRFPRNRTRQSPRGSASGPNNSPPRGRAAPRTGKSHGTGKGQGTGKGPRVGKAPRAGQAAGAAANDRPGRRERFAKPAGGLKNKAAGGKPTTASRGDLRSADRRPERPRATLKTASAKPSAGKHHSGKAAGGQTATGRRTAKKTFSKRRGR